MCGSTNRSMIEDPWVYGIDGLVVFFPSHPEAYGKNLL